MKVTVRSMDPGEIDLVINYFHGSTPEHLELLGVDPTRLPEPGQWRKRAARELATPVEERSVTYLVWESGGTPVGFSGCDRITYGDHAFMHLHVIDPDRRAAGIGTVAVRRSAAIYFEQLRLRRLFCEPNAFNVAPNRTLQRAGFRYVKTHRTVPGRLNYHQAVTRWVLDVPPA